jgi:predicted dinucleotide-binding enzyme
MKVAVLGAGRIGGNCARQLVRGGHDVVLAFSRDPARLEQAAEELGRASAASPAEAAADSEAVILSVPWSTIPEALEQAGDLGGKIVIDTTNQFGGGGWIELGTTAAAHNAARMPGARYTKSFNTLTAAFQAEAADRQGDERVVQWICGDDEEAKRAAAQLVEDCGYAPVDLAGTEDCAPMEAPRREGAVYGEEYRPADAAAVVEAVRAGRPIPPTTRKG